MVANISVTCTGSEPSLAQAARDSIGLVDSSLESLFGTSSAGVKKVCSHTSPDYLCPVKAWVQRYGDGSGMAGRGYMDQRELGATYVWIRDQWVSTYNDAFGKNSDYSVSQRGR